MVSPELDICKILTPLIEETSKNIKAIQVNEGYKIALTHLRDYISEQRIDQTLKEDSNKILNIILNELKKYNNNITPLDKKQLITLLEYSRTQLIILRRRFENTI